MAVEVALDAVPALALAAMEMGRTCSSPIVAVRCTLTWFASVWSISDVDDDSSLQCASCACTSRSERLASSWLGLGLGLLLRAPGTVAGSEQAAGARVHAGPPWHLNKREGVLFGHHPSPFCCRWRCVRKLKGRNPRTCS